MSRIATASGPFFKTPMYRSKPLRDFAIVVPHCMACKRPNDGTIVAAHSNQLRDAKGRGLKAHDFRVAYCCDACHREIDQGRAPQDERLARWEAAHRETIGWLFLNGHITLSALPAEPFARPQPRQPNTTG